MCHTRWHLGVTPAYTPKSFLTGSGPCGMPGIEHGPIWGCLHARQTPYNCAIAWAPEVRFLNYKDLNNQPVLGAGER